LALAIRLVAASQIPMPSTEPSAYYADVAGSLVSGEGLVSHAVWSYASGPLIARKPAFELWLPMSSLVSALSMTVPGSTWWAAQVGSALLGALVALLTWAVARGAARGAGLDARRTRAVAIASRSWQPSSVRWCSPLPFPIRTCRTWPSRSWRSYSSPHGWGSVTARQRHRPGVRPGSLASASAS
jgi:hypothetical protein